MKKQHACFHCGELYDRDRPACPHCGADRDFTYAEAPTELVAPDEDREYGDFLESEGLSDRPRARRGCGTMILVVVSGLLWLLL